jgi:hypothetical protein
MVSTGPVDAWLSAGETGEPEFFGHCEAPGFSVDWLWRYAQHMNDLGGIKEPYDQSYQGKAALISGVLTRLDWNVLEAFTTFGAGGSSGVDVPGDIGTLIMTEAAGFELFLRFPYARKFPGIGLAAGLHFPVCKWDRETFQNLTPGAAAVAVAIYALRDFDAEISNEFGWGGWTLFDGDVSSLPAVGS